jgi:hypothetical protein
LAAGLVFVQAVSLNFIATRFRLSEEITLFSGIFYILLTSSILELAMPTPTLFAASFLIIILYSLFETYRKAESSVSIFNIGLWVAVGSFFHFSFGLFILLGVIGINVLRAYNFREILMLLIGVSTAYFLVGSCYFFYDAFDIFWNEQFTKNIAFFNLVAPNIWTTYMERIFIALLLIIALLSQGIYSFKKNIQVQKFQTVLYWAMLLAGLTILFQANLSLAQLIFLMPSLAFFMMYNFLRFEKSNAETFHAIWILLIIILQLHQKIGF